MLIKTTTWYHDTPTQELLTLKTSVTRIDEVGKDVEQWELSPAFLVRMQNITAILQSNITVFYNDKYSFIVIQSLKSFNSAVPWTAAR